MRTKFKIDEVKPQDKGFTIRLTAIPEGSEENAAAFDSVGGMITLSVVKAEEAAKFIAGQEVFVDFTPIEAPAA